MVINNDICDLQYWQHRGKKRGSSEDFSEHYMKEGDNDSWKEAWGWGINPIYGSNCKDAYWEYPDPAEWNGRKGIWEDQNISIKGRFGNYLPSESQVSDLQIRSKILRDRIQYMKYHVLIGKFVSIVPLEKALVWRTKST